MNNAKHDTVKSTKNNAKHDTVKSLKNDMAEVNAETDERLTKVEGSISKLSETFESGMGSLLDSMESFKSLAKNNPTSITKDGPLSSDVYEHADEHGIEFEKNRDPNDDVEVVRHGITSVDNAEFKAKAEQMKFDNETIEIMVMPSQSQYPDHTFTIGVNGRLRLILRGTKQWLPRKYVEVLLRAKISSYGNFERRNEYTGELEVKNPETKSHRYPLQILTDKNPKGAAWLIRVTNDMAA